MNDPTDFHLLAEIMREAAWYCVWPKGRQRLMEVMLNFSYRLGKPEAAFSSHEPLLRHAGMNEQRLSEALNDLVCYRVARREGKGRGGLKLIPVPLWQDWALRPIAPEYADKEYVASLVRYTVKLTTAGYVAVAYPAQAVGPVTQYALAYARGEFDQEHLIPNDQMLNEPIAEIARQVAAFAGEPKRRPGRPSGRKERIPLRSESEAPIDVDEQEVQDYTARLFGGEWVDAHGKPWERARREGWVKKVCEDKGPRVLFRALQAAQDFGPSRIRAPWAWLAPILESISAAQGKA